MTLSHDDAEIIALKALGFLVSSGERTDRFLALTGIAPGDLRAMAGDDQLLAGVLEHLLADESLLLVFAETNDIDPALPALAVKLLRGG